MDKIELIIKIITEIEDRLSTFESQARLYPQSSSSQKIDESQVELIKVEVKNKRFNLRIMIKNIIRRKFGLKSNSMPFL